MPLRVAAEVIVDAEPEVTWRAAVDRPRQHKWIWATRVNGSHGAGAAGLMPVPVSKD